MKKKCLLLFLLLILFTLLVFIAYAFLKSRIKREFISKKLGYRVSIPLNLWHYKNDQYIGECDEFTRYKPPTIPFFAVYEDHYSDFSVNVCIYRNTDIPEHLHNISAYGEKINSDFKISGVLTDWYVGGGMIGELNTILIENRGNVYRISFWLPFQDDQDFYGKEKQKATEFLKPFEFVEK